MSAENNLEGISDWLILVAIGVVISPIRISISMMKTFPELFSTGVWDALTTPETSVYSPFWAPLIIVEILLNCALLLTSIYIAYLFFTKKKRFPKWYIGIMVFSLVFMVFEAFLANLLFPSVPVFDSGMTIDFVRSLIYAAIWIPYMLVSKRVKATFIQ